MTLILYIIVTKKNNDSFFSLVAFFACLNQTGAHFAPMAVFTPHSTPWSSLKVISRLAPLDMLEIT